MVQALKDLFASKKFLVMLAGVILAITSKLGLHLDPDLVNQILALAGVYIVGQGIADHGKEAEKVVAAAALDNPMPVNDNASAVALKQAGFARFGLMLVILAIGAIAFSACAWLSKESKQVAHDIIDCTTSSAKDATKQFGPVVDALLAQATDDGGKVNWSPVKDLTKNFGAELGGCVLADTVARALHPKPADPNAPKSSPLELDQTSLLAGFNALRTEQLGGKSFKTELGVL